MKPPRRLLILRKGMKDSRRKQTSKDKLITDGVSLLKYHRYSATSFVNFETDLRLVAGVEFGISFVMW